MSVFMLANGVVALVLILAGVSKLRSSRWPVLALEMGTPRLLVVTLPAFEVLLGMALMLRVGRPYVAWIGASVFLVFAVVVTIQYVRGSDAPCLCFGGNEAAVTRLTIARNVTLLGLAVLGSF